MFFGESGSIAGGTIRTPPSRPSGTYCCMCQTLASYGSISGRRRAMVDGFGVERSMWQRQTQCRDFSGAFVEQAGRLRVVDDHDVPALLEVARVHRVVALEDLPLLVRDRLLVALERVVHQLRDVEELLAPEDHVPVRVEADVAHQRHDRVEDLRDAAAERGRVDVQDALALERLRERRGSARSGPSPRCACSRPASAGRGRLPEASAESYLSVGDDLDAAVDRAEDPVVELAVGGRHAGHLELRAGAEERAVGERRCRTRR